MRVLSTALKHGITETQILAALKVPMRRVSLDDDLLLVIGADRSGLLLELLVAGPESTDPRVIHAMPLRTKFYYYL